MHVDYSPTLIRGRMEDVFISLPGIVAESLVARSLSAGHSFAMRAAAHAMSMLASAIFKRRSLLSAAAAAL